MPREYQTGAAQHAVRWKKWLHAWLPVLPRIDTDALSISLDFPEGLLRRFMDRFTVTDSVYL